MFSQENHNYFGDVYKYKFNAYHVKCNNLYSMQYCMFPKHRPLYNYDGNGDLLHSRSCDMFWLFIIHCVKWFIFLC